jgi:hypothetical protein
VEGCIQLGVARCLVPVVRTDVPAGCRVALVRGPTGHLSVRRRPTALQVASGQGTVSGHNVRGGLRAVHPMIGPIRLLGVDGEMNGVGSCPSNRDGLPIGGFSHC